MNRQTKRLLARQQAAQERGQRLAAPPRATPGAPGERRKRTPPRQFLREVRSELKKVAWPTRGEVFTYTVVVLVTVTFVTFFVFGLDYGFARAVLKVFSR
ncbi:MAG TPA: preprotein translocase subunit SecE [Actinomycetota bacterium]|nr:preprotein translocase subunit SecE [Actinomycetota bacterium]